jgi:rhodanese-related sulfurtransferase
VREPGEFGAGHVLGAKNLPIARLEAPGPEIAKRKDKPVVVYCDGGDRSAKALALLKKQGFTRAANLSGGLKAWQQAGLPVEK